MYCIRADIDHAMSARCADESPKYRRAPGAGTTQQKKCGVSHSAILGHSSARSAATSAVSDRIPRLIAKSAANTSVAADTVSCTRDSRPLP